MLGSRHEVLFVVVPGDHGDPLVHPGHLLLHQPLLALRPPERVGQPTIVDEAVPGKKNENREGK